MDAPVDEDYFAAAPARSSQGSEGENDPLLPIFDASHLDRIPVYNLVHALRVLIVSRIETSLTWDQIKSPQISSFLIRPMEETIRESHTNRATAFALLANLLQFRKEEQMKPALAGTNRTRAMVCELLAMRMLKQFTTRELIDVLCYEWHPLQGMAQANTSNGAQGKLSALNSPRPTAARSSALEVAIKANAKRFIAHPVVVQQLEAIWAGNIVFHSAADNLHRRNSKASRSSGYGTMNSTRDPQVEFISAQGEQRGVTIYDPREAGPFKLSRLRVPRYRHVFSTLSFAVLLGLFLGVLMEHDDNITGLEIFFWFWSFGYMLDELVGFNEQGFSLYIMSIWNLFDIGILIFLSAYIFLRAYTFFLDDPLTNRLWNEIAYEILAANAVLLFPRLFSALDHYRYFSQLLIAFRIMAQDLIAVIILIVISCSGFFIAFSFGTSDHTPKDVSYRMLQMLLGFTPAAWEIMWDYNILGRFILVIFLILTHYVIVTILITVLTNSFMSIAANAHEEHQFLFAVNTLSMVKNDALFSYVAPSNILAWVLTPLRFMLPLHEFVKLNRYVIKITHFPLLWIIYLYERLFVARNIFVPEDLIENNHLGGGPIRNRMISFAEGLLSPPVTIRFRGEGSTVGHHQDRALSEVFSIAPSSIRPKVLQRSQTQHNITHWMDQQPELNELEEDDARLAGSVEDDDGGDVHSEPMSTMLPSASVAGMRERDVRSDGEEERDPMGESRDSLLVRHWSHDSRGSGPGVQGLGAGESRSRDREVSDMGTGSGTVRRAPQNLTVDLSRERERRYSGLSRDGDGRRVGASQDRTREASTMRSPLIRDRSGTPESRFRTRRRRGSTGPKV